MDIAKLEAKRAKLVEQLKAVDAKIAKERKRQEEEQAREVARLIKEHGLTTEQIRALIARQQPQQTATIEGVSE